MHYLFLIFLILFVIWFVFPQTSQANPVYTDTDYERRYGWEGPLWGPRNSFT
jgi:hypothetical protein